MKNACLLCVLLAAATAGAAAAEDARNLALARPYTMSLAPNYALCTDPQDAVQLTDGKYADPGMFWGQPAAVG
jgi:hypothetical protein